MDEQCIADIAANIIGGQVIDRSKEALDLIYESGSQEGKRIAKALDLYGADRFKVEFKYCIDELLKVCNAGTPKKLRSILFKRLTSNPFPSVFAVLLAALHEALVVSKKKISNYDGIKSAISDLSDRIETSRRSTSPEERRKNIDTIKGLIDSHLVSGDPIAYRGSNSSTDVDTIIRRSEIELPHYELKQGILRIASVNRIDQGVFGKVINTICAMANNGKDYAGSILIGVTDKDADAGRIEKLYSIKGRKVAKRHVVGVSREAEALGETIEQYFGRWKDAIRNSDLSSSLRDAVLSSIDFNDYFGLGVITITVPPQRELSYVGDKLYKRDGDETVEVTDPKGAANLAMRFR
jgi:hypothetical protein